MHSTVDGVAFTAEHTFLDDNGNPIRAKPGYPKAILSKNKQRVTTAIGTPADEPGQWEFTVNVPVLSNTEPERMTLTLLLRDLRDNTHSESRSVEIAPAVDTRFTDVVCLSEDDEFEATIPCVNARQVADPVTVRGFFNNEMLFNTAVSIRKGADRFVFEFPARELPVSLSPSLLQVSYTVGGKAFKHSLKAWCVTPQIVLAQTHIIDQLDKARITNDLPELDYTDGDLLSYLERGLHMFNTIGFPTAFTGTNMQGPLFDAWLMCSTYYALCAQLLAESQLAFNYGGQGVTLDMDRSQGLEAALGRIESKLNDYVMPLKKHLSRQSIIAGDGSVGASSLRNKFGQAWVGVTNAPTTRLTMGVGTRYVGRRG